MVYQLHYVDREGRIIDRATDDARSDNEAVEHARIAFTPFAVKGAHGVIVYDGDHEVGRWSQPGITDA